MKLTEKELKVAALSLDRLGYFPKEVAGHFISEGLFQLFVPDSIKEHPENSISGEKDLIRAVKTIERYSKIDGNMGWILQIGAGAGIFAAYLGEQQAKKYFSKPHQVVAGSGYPSGTALPVRGGYSISGSWKFASGAYHASIFTANCVVKGEDRIISVIIPPGKVTVIPTWNGMGMRATDSHTFEVEEVFIPEEDTFEITDEKLVISSPLYKLPFDVFARAVFVPVFLGMAADYQEVFNDYIGRKYPQGETSVEGVLERWTTVIGQQRKDFYRDLGEIWELIGRGEPAQEKARSFSGLCIDLKEVLTVHLQECHKYTGMEGIRMDARINVLYRNFITAGAHYLLSPLESGSH